MLYLNGKKLIIEKFPNGESKLDGKHISQICENMNVCHHGIKGIKNIMLRFENNEDLIHLMFLKRKLDDLNEYSNLIISYMPYSRMDRQEKDCVFTLKYISEFINGMNFKNVTIFESHSDVSLALLDRSSNAEYSNYLLSIAKNRVKFDEEKDYIYYPDATAEKRYSKAISSKSLVGLKQRDFVTGKIKKLDVYGDVKEKGFNVIMIDDLCSRGGTFLLGAQKLKEMGANNIYLVVTHCENTVFDGDMIESDLITKVYTTDSMVRNKTHDKIRVFKLCDYNDRGQ